jgi:hypothetical protein
MHATEKNHRFPQDHTNVEKMMFRRTRRTASQVFAAE